MPTDPMTPLTKEAEARLAHIQQRLAKLRDPFPAHQISKLPKPTTKDGTKGKCAECGGYHQLPAIHIDYVGHAALTDRLLDVDPLWAWEPVAFAPDGLPLFDKSGGLWIRLTICGVTRLGYGAAEAKSYADVGAREKEVIGDALRNAAMRFGAALDLWHKGELHADQEREPAKVAPARDDGRAAVASGTSSPRPGTRPTPVPVASSSQSPRPTPSPSTAAPASTTTPTFIAGIVETSGNTAGKPWTRRVVKFTSRVAATDGRLLDQATTFEQPIADLLTRARDEQTPILPHIEPNEKRKGMYDIKRVDFPDFPA